MELPHLPRIKVWQRGLKRDGQHPYVGTIGTIRDVPLAGGIESGKKISLCMCGVHMLAEDRRGELWPEQTSVT